MLRDSEIRDNTGMRAFVISLARRADRLKRFTDHVAANGLNEVFVFETIEAVDGRELDLAALQPRIAQPNNPRNVMSHPEPQARGILGCALSHLEAWRRVSELTSPAAVFEDDARLSKEVSAKMVASALRELPSGVDLCWLNDCHYDARGGLRFRLRRRLSRYVGALPRPSRVSFTRMPDMMVATDAYIVTPDFARRARAETVDNLGAIDRHMQLFIARRQCRVYQTYPALFTTDFTDSDTSPRESGAHQQKR